VFTDIIVGFTGETDEAFENTRKIMNEFKYNMAYIAQYSVRPGATSSRWADDVPREVKNARFHQLSQDLRKHAAMHNRRMIGKTFRVLVTGNDRKEGYLSALTEGKIVCRFASGDETLVGNFVHIKIQSSTDFSVEGELVMAEAKA
jgi:tRNA-2-methylthio-N6-dimethylallyladenosine synthase